ncbi:seminase [Drosophila teissieri]|uniref:seminase n=1 Tax=Drosophila teissieri TaxID=7243 RepID=UPI001CBA3D80|nr:seminase [Drosophila teissieri]
MQRLQILLLLIGISMHNYALKYNETIDVNKLAKIVMPRAYQTRVVGGRVTTNEKLGGYLMAMRYYNNFICGGALIRELIVLTAAHCFEDRELSEAWSVDGGISRLSDTGVRRQVKRIIKSGQFKMVSMTMDVAVVLLNRPMVGKNIATVSLCSTPLTPGMILVVSGWGMTHSDSMGPNLMLRTVSVPVIEKKVCRDVYREAVSISDSMFCASVLGKKDACTYDSGGPLVYNKQVCGIVSFGIGCASRKFPGVYTDVHFVKPFIEKSINLLLSR